MIGRALFYRLCLSSMDPFRLFRRLPIRRRIPSWRQPFSFPSKTFGAAGEACKVLRSFQLTGCEVYASCEPCPMCMAALYWARPSGIFFAGTREDAARAGFDDSYIYQQLALPVDQRSIPTVQMLREQALV